MTLIQKHCLLCGSGFEARPQTPHQRICSQAACQKKRHKKACVTWNKKHPQNDRSRRLKIRAWARSYADYWQHYRRTHPDYVARERERLRAKRRAARNVAKQDAWRQMAVDKLLAIAATPAQDVAKQDVCDRRVDGVLDYLLWKEGVAKLDGIALDAPVA